MESMENNLIKLLKLAVNDRKQKYDQKMVNSRDLLTELRRDIGRLAFYGHCFEFTIIIPKLSFANSLLDNIFSEKLSEIIAVLIPSESFELPELIKDSLMDELINLDFDGYFDDDYIIRLDKIEESLTTIKNLKKMAEISNSAVNQKIIFGILCVINNASKEAIKIIDKYVETFFGALLNALEEEPTASRLNKEVDAFVKLLHEGCYGWT